ncbi:MAG: subclass B3 metallo-beta-lactamase [Paucibacter sp.]|nr:subclass B3 metallo-beta-lactamase [Roseateles sp.]
MRTLLLTPLLAPLLIASAFAGTEPLPQLKAYEAQPAWLQPIEPLRISDHVWQIGTSGITALLVKTGEGALLIDGGMPQAADLVLAQIRKLDAEPLRLILHSHAHADHVGPLAAIRRATGAQMVTNAESAAMMARGGFHDIHFGDGISYPPVQADRLLQDGEVVRLGAMAFTVTFTPGHTPGSMSWTWTDTLQGRPVRIAYVDSLTAPGYKLVGNAAYPHIVDDYRRSIARVRALPCDLLLTPHPEFSGWNYTDAARPHPQPTSCKTYADEAEKALDERLKASAP